MKISIINGPNLNLLGLREPKIYGKFTLSNIKKKCIEEAKNNNIKIDFLQSNYEGKIIQFIHNAYEKKHFSIIINAAAFTHTSIAILDALKLVNLPIYEVHLSNIYAREKFRHHSYISPIAKGIICGLGINGYLIAIKNIAQNIKNITA